MTTLKFLWCWFLSVQPIDPADEYRNSYADYIVDRYGS